MNWNEYERRDRGLISSRRWPGGTAKITKTYQDSQSPDRYLDSEPLEYEVEVLSNWPLCLFIFIERQKEIK
jgi:hypothetical protein